MEVPLSQDCFCTVEKTIHFSFPNYEVKKVSLFNSRHSIVYPDTVVYSPPPPSLLSMFQGPISQWTQNLNITFKALKYDRIAIEFWNGMPAGFDLASRVTYSGGLCIVSNIPDPDFP